MATAQARGSTATNTELALAQARVAVQEGQVAVLAAQEARRKLATGAETTALATAQADVDKKRLAVSEATTTLAGTKLVAPFDATVLQTPVKVGDQIGASTTIVAVANLKTLQVIAAIDEITIRRVVEGQDVVLTFDAFPGQRFQGQVLAIPLQGTLQGGVMVYDVPMSLRGVEKLPLLVGMTANAQVQMAQVRDALLVPAMAVQRVNGQYEVLVANPADPQSPPFAVPVEVGLSDGIYTQITNGLQPGDQVVLQVEATQATTPAGGSGAQNPLMNVIRQFSRPAGR